MLAFWLACWPAGASAARLWSITAASDSTVAPGSQLTFHVDLKDLGDENPDGTPYKVTAILPAGITPVNAFDILGNFTCQNSTSEVVCTATRAESHGSLNPLDFVVAVAPNAEGALTARFAVEGGGAPPARAARTVNVTNVPPTFGIDSFDAQVTSDAAGTAFTQAGGHPYEATTAFFINTQDDLNPLNGDPSPVEPLKDVSVELPAGFSGDPTGVPQCTTAQLAVQESGTGTPLCASDSQVGTAAIYIQSFLGNTAGPVSVFNMVPPLGVPARFGMNVGGTLVFFDAHVRTSGDYGLSVTSRDTSEGLPIIGARVTFWGVPSDPSHDFERSCPGSGPPLAGEGGTCTSGAPPRAFLRNPTSCTSPGVGLPTTLHVTSWYHPEVVRSGTVVSHLSPGFPSAPDEWGAAQGTTGCGLVPFEPALHVTPDTAAAGAPAGYTFDLAMPQSTDPETIAQSDVRKIELALPPGARLNPASASGLKACSEEQIALHSEAAETCPEASKLGAVTITAPALEKPLTGSLYLATPYANPSGSLVAVYLVATGSGVTVKLPGQVKLDPLTGDATTVFDEDPQLPFEDVHVVLKGGPRAAFTNPPACGTYAAHAQLTGWSGAVSTLEPNFTLDQGPEGGACAAPGFAPGFAAGTTNPQGGAFSPFVLSFTRTDSEQQLRGLTDTLPPGALADLATVTRCPDAQANAGSCPESSRIGSVTVASGAGPNPYYLKGTVYLTGPYNGGPFGEAVVVPAVAGPFDLGDVVVRGSIRIDPATSQATVVSDPLPQYVGDTGIPTDVRRIDVVLDRPGFTFNPTDCAEEAATGQLTSVTGASLPVSNRFEAANCANLKFRPSFTVSTQASGELKRHGASLDVKIAAPGQGPGVPEGGREANIAKVETQLPLALPSRLTTLQKACTESQFATNPAGCPSASFVGTAVAHTPILSSPLEGPAVLVSHGGRAFPDLVLVLQGEGITLEVTGHTQIKNGVTYSRFETVPDAPISSFELKLPEGPFSVLAAGEPLCGKTVTSTKKVRRHGRTVKVSARRHVATKLAMPTRITAQNGAVEELRPSIAVKGCSGAKTARTAGKKGKGARR